MNYVDIMASCNSSECSSVTLLSYKRKRLVFWCCLTVWNFGPRSLVTSGILITRLSSFSLFCVFPHSSAQLKGAIFVESIKLLLAPAPFSSLSTSLLRPSSKLLYPPVSSCFLYYQPLCEQLTQQHFSYPVTLGSIWPREAGARFPDAPHQWSHACEKNTTGHIAGHK